MVMHRPLQKKYSLYTENQITILLFSYENYNFRRAY